MAKKRGGKSGPAHSRTNAPRQKKTAEVAQEPPDQIREILRFLGSLKLAVVLLLVSMLVLVAGTLLDDAKGLEYARWFVYHSWWFITLASVLAVNVLVAMLLRIPWKRRHIGFLIVHAGLLVLMAGSILTFVEGIDGHLSIVEGGPAVGAVTVTERSQLTASWRDGDEIIDFPFKPGPADWPDGKTKDLGELDEVRVKVLQFYRYAIGEIGWGEDPSGISPPAIQFALIGPDNKQVADKWLVGRKGIGAKLTFGPANVALQEVPVASMLGDLLNPPTDNLGDKGLVSIYYKDQVEQVPVDDNVGKTVAIGSDGTKVEIVQYLAQPTMGPGGTLTSAGDEPNNPMLELWVHLPGGKEPLRQFSLAKTPLMDFSGSRGIACPVKFFYHHAAVPVQKAVEFFQTPDGKLSCRVGDGKRYKSHGAVDKGGLIETSAGYSVRLLRHVRNARQQPTFESVEYDPEWLRPPEAAARFEVSMADKTYEMWLQRGGGEHGFYTVQTPKGRMDFSFGYTRSPLGSKMRLIEFTREFNPGGMGDASYSSEVEVIDESGRRQKHEISMNKPLEHGKFTFYQSGFPKTADGRQMSTLTAAYDPGRYLKYGASVMICLGAFVMFYLRGRI